MYGLSNGENIFWPQVAFEGQGQTLKPSKSNIWKTVWDREASAWGVFVRRFRPEEFSSAGDFGLGSFCQLAISTWALCYLLCSALLLTNCEGSHSVRLNNYFVTLNIVVTVDVIGIDNICQKLEITTSHFRLKASANRTLHHFVQ